MAQAIINYNKRFNSNVFMGLPGSVDDSRVLQKLF